jgi:hypothetical protein
MSPKDKTTPEGQPRPPKKTDAEIVEEYMTSLHHPLKAEINEIRKIIKNAHPGISERIKWNAPSYYYREDMVTFHPRDQERVHLVFHHKNIVDIDSPLLEGEYKDRRMMYFSSMKEVKEKKAELEGILKALIQYIDA